MGNLGITTAGMLIASGAPFTGNGVCHVRNNRGRCRPFNIRFISAAGTVGITMNSSVTLSNIVGCAPFDFARISNLFSVTIPTVVSVTRGTALRTAILGDNGRPVSFRCSLNSPRFRFKRGTIVIASAPNRFFTADRLSTGNCINCTIGF